MVRTQIQLTEAQARALRAQARAQERSMADLVRESVSEYLARRPVADRDELARRALAVAGRYRSGCRDLAVATLTGDLDEALRFVRLVVRRVPLLAFLRYADQPRPRVEEPCGRRSGSSGRCRAATSSGHLPNYVLVEGASQVVQRAASREGPGPPASERPCTKADTVVPGRCGPLWVDEELHATPPPHATASPSGAGSCTAGRLHESSSSCDAMASPMRFPWQRRFRAPGLRASASVQQLSAPHPPDAQP